MDGNAPNPRATWPAEYANGESIEGIARKHGASFGAVRMELLARGVEMRPQGSRPGNTTSGGPTRTATISARRLAWEAAHAPQEPVEAGLPTRPTTRGECLQGEGAQRPCPFVSCKQHLYLDASALDGAITLRFPGLEVWEMTRSCALDEVDATPDGMTLDDAGARIGVTRERARQIEETGLRKVRLVVL